jgi:hypothetical protein
LPKAKIRKAVRRTGDSYAIKLISDDPAMHVEVSTGKLAGRLSDNILTLLPGRAVTVQFTPDKPTTLVAVKEQLKVRSVRDTY